MRRACLVAHNRAVRALDGSQRCIAAGGSGRVILFNYTTEGLPRLLWRLWSSRCLLPPSMIFTRTCRRSKRYFRIFAGLALTKP